MNKIRKTLTFTFLLIFLITGCSTAITADPSLPAPDAQAALKRDGLDSYSADFQVKFTGASSWTYQLKTRKSAGLREVTLHIEGLQGEQNPGDIRLVTDGETTWMIGEGTDQECIEFPNGEGMDPNFIYPETLLTAQDLNTIMKLAGEEKIGGAAVQHFQAAGATAGPWEDAAIDIWQVKNSAILYKFTMQANGDDPFFSAGPGQVNAEYSAQALGDAAIEPVPGCEISVPLPESAEVFVRLPGMASFESSSPVFRISEFYQSILPEQGWAENEPAAQSDGSTILSYRRGAEIVEVHIEATAADGSKVKLLFVPVQ